MFQKYWSLKSVDDSVSQLGDLQRAIPCAHTYLQKKPDDPDMLWVHVTDHEEQSYEVTSGAFRSLSIIYQTFYTAFFLPLWSLCHLADKASIIFSRLAFWEGWNSSTQAISVVVSDWRRKLWSSTSMSKTSVRRIVRESFIFYRMLTSTQPCQVCMKSMNLNRNILDDVSCLSYKIMAKRVKIVHDGIFNFFQRCIHQHIKM